MIEMRPDQVTAFGAARRAEFLTRLATHLRKHFPDKLQSMPDEELSKYCATCLDRAAHYGLQHEQAVACYAHLPLILGLDFEQNSNYRFAVDILHDREQNQDTRAKVAVALAYNFKARGL